MNKNIPDFSAFVIPILAKEAMKYKEQIKTNELITKIRIIRYVKKENLPIVQVADSFSMHRNTIGKIIKAFEKTITPQDQHLLLCPSSKTSSD